MMKRITVPEEGIETLFGSYDENLKHLESLFNVRIRTQGHDLLVEGDAAGPRQGRPRRRPAVVADARRLQAVERRRQDRRPTSSRRTTTVDLRDHFLKGSLTRGGQAPRRAEDRQPAPLPRRDRAARHRVRHRPGRHRQDLPGDGAGGRVSGRQEGQPHHPGAAGGRGGREARLPAGRPAGEGEPVPAAALRRALRHARRRARRRATSSAARSRSRRSRSCAAAR